MEPDAKELMMWREINPVRRKYEEKRAKLNGQPGNENELERLTAEQDEVIGEIMARYALTRDDFRKLYPTRVWTIH